MAHWNLSTYLNVCEITNNLSTNFSFKFVFTLQILAAPFGVLMNLIMCWLVCKRSLYHLNLKFLLCHLHIMIIWYCCGLAFKSINMLQKLDSDPCALVSDQYWCKAVEIVIYIFPLYNTVYALLIIEIEQFYGIWKFQTEHQMKNICLPVLLIIVSWLVALTPQVTPFLTMGSVELMPTCMNLLTLGKSGLIFLIGTGGTMEILALALSFVNYYLCSRKVKYYAINQAHYSLRDRFLLLQTMSMSRTVLPATFLHCLVWIPFLVALLYLGLDFNAAYATRVALINAAYLFGMIFANVYPIIILRQNAGIWYKFKRDIYDTCGGTQWVNCLVTSPRDVPTPMRLLRGNQASDAHFDYLESLWRKH